MSLKNIYINKKSLKMTLETSMTIFIKGDAGSE